MRLLLCEDEKELSTALTAILEHNHYSVDAVYDGQDALDYIQSGVYDGVILDIMMPKLDGISVLKEVRKCKNNVPIILLTAKSEIDDRVLGLDCGANDYLPKPFSTKELLARIRAMTRSGAEQLDTTLSFNNLHLDTVTFEISTETDSIKLAGKEFQMMEMLMKNPKAVISAETFMDKIWGYESEAEISVVWVYISNLRKKLAKLNSKAQIKVSRNIGYYLEGSDD